MFPAPSAGVSTASATTSPSAYPSYPDDPGHVLIPVTLDQAQTLLSQQQARDTDIAEVYLQRADVPDVYKTTATKELVQLVLDRGYQVSMNLVVHGEGGTSWPLFMKNNEMPLRSVVVGERGTSMKSDTHFITYLTMMLALPRNDTVTWRQWLWSILSYFFTFS